MKVFSGNQPRLSQIAGIGGAFVLFAYALHELAYITIPVWLYVCLALAVIVAIYAPSMLERRKKYRNQLASFLYCPSCGYNLRGLAARDGELTCPECGYQTSALGKTKKPS